LGIERASAGSTCTVYTPQKSASFATLKHPCRLFTHDGQNTLRRCGSCGLFRGMAPRNDTRFVVYCVNGYQVTRKMMFLYNTKNFFSTGRRKRSKNPAECHASRNVCEKPNCKGTFNRHPDFCKDERVFASSKKC